MDSKYSSVGFKKSQWGKSIDDYHAMATDRKIRNIIHRKRASLVLETSYKNFSNSKPPASNLFEVISNHEVVKSVVNRHSVTFSKDAEKISMLRSQKSQIEAAKQLANNNIFDLQEKIKELFTFIQQVNEEYLKEADTDMILSHIFDRMRTTIVFLKERQRVLNTELHNIDFSLQNITKRSKKTKESKHSTQQALDSFKETISFEKKTKNQDISMMKKNVQIVKQISEKKLEHNMKEIELSEQIMINDTCVSLKELKEKLYVHFLWYMASSVQFEKEKIKLKIYEDAYMKIKIATGIQDVPSLVEKYFTRESTYTHFAEMVKIKEKELGEYQDKIEILQKQIDNSDTIMVTEEWSGIARSPSELRLCEKQLFEDNLKLKRYAFLRNKVVDWIEKISVRVKGISEGNSEELRKIKLSQSIGKISEFVLNYIHSNNLASEKARGVIENIKRMKMKMIVDNLKPKPSQMELDHVDSMELNHAEE